MTKSTQISASSQSVLGVPMLVTAMLFLTSMHFVFAALLKPYLTPSLSVFYILSIATVEVGVYLSFRGGIHFDVFNQNRWFFIILGAAIAISANLNYLAVFYIDPGVAALLNQSEVLFGLGFGLFWLRESLNRRQALGAAVAILGVIIVSYQSSDIFRLGSFLILGSAFCYALHAALTKRFAGDMDLGSFFFFRLLLTAIWMFSIHAVFSLSSNQAILAWPTWPGGFMIFLVASVDVGISRALYYAVLRRLPLSIHTLVLTLAPALTICWSYLLFNHPPNIQQLIGGVGIIGGVMLITWRRG